MAEAAATIEAPERDAPAAAGENGGAPPTIEIDAEGATALADGPTIAGHPRAVRSVARAKGWGGLLGFALGGYLSLPTHTLADAGLRALVAGAACYVAVWAGALFVWRRLVMLEIKAREQQLLGEALAAGGIPTQGSAPSTAARAPQAQGGGTAS